MRRPLLTIFANLLEILEIRAIQVYGRLFGLTVLSNTYSVYEGGANMKRKWRQVIGLLGLTAMMVVAMGCAQQAQPKKAPKPVAELESIYFDFDRSDIKSEYKPVLEDNAAWMKDHDNSDVVIEGNCDQRGSVEYNIALGWRRARSGKNYMVSLGVDAGRLSTKSFGKEQPVCTEMMESCWWKNRRDDFKAN
jgi:peptidoglycan-associated lipoprotein